MKQGQLIAQELFYPPPMYQVYFQENKFSSLLHPPPFHLTNKDIAVIGSTIRCDRQMLELGVSADEMKHIKKKLGLV